MIFKWLLSNDFQMLSAEHSSMLSQMIFIHITNTSHRRCLCTSCSCCHDVQHMSNCKACLKINWTSVDTYVKTFVNALAKTFVNALANDISRLLSNDFQMLLADAFSKCTSRDIRRCTRKCFSKCTCKWFSFALTSALNSLVNNGDIVDPSKSYD